MADFECPRCKNATLTIVRSVELGASDDDDERSLQLIACPCGLLGAAEYHESRRGAGESWYHDAFELDPAGYTAVEDHVTRVEWPPGGVAGVTTPLSRFAMRWHS